jgi:hypothetical protein
MTQFLLIIIICILCPPIAWALVAWMAYALISLLIEDALDKVKKRL